MIIILWGLCGDKQGMAKKMTVHSMLIEGKKNLILMGKEKGKVS